MTPTVLVQALYDIGMVSYLQRPRTFMCVPAYLGAVKA